MAKVKVRVLDAVVDGHKKGEVISIDERSAKHLESLRYVQRVGGKASDDDVATAGTGVEKVGDTAPEENQTDKKTVESKK
jgi:hypothetical protein